MPHQTVSLTIHAAAAAGASLLALSVAVLALGALSTQAFQPSLMVRQSLPKFSRPYFNDEQGGRRPDTSMRYQSPWDLAANSGSRKRLPESGWGGSLVGSESSLGPLVFSLPGMLDNPLNVGDPEVTETDTGFTLAFNLPADVKEDGLDVSVSGRLLTIEARVTHEDKAGPGVGSSGGEGAVERGGWATRSSRTHSCARSFVLPTNVCSNDVTAKWVSEGKVEIQLEKVHLAAQEATTSPVDSAGPSMADSGGVPVECKEEKPIPIPSSAAEEYLSGLQSAKHATGSVGVRSPAGPLAEPWAFPLEGPERRHRSMLAALDEEFRHFAKEMFSYGALRFPTEEQVAATVAKAREERERRVTAMRRATMATDVSERELSYVVR